MNPNNGKAKDARPFHGCYVITYISSLSARRYWAALGRVVIEFGRMDLSAAVL